MYDALKAKGLLIKWNIKNFWHQSHNGMFWFKKNKCYDEYEAKWKASKLFYQVLWKVIYVYFYNWDGSHYLVLIVLFSLNWPLKLHIRLKLSHFLYPHISLKSICNECHINLCDCTWLNVFSHALSLLIKHKKIFECFSCFWKIFCFYKNYQNFKNIVTLF